MKRNKKKRKIKKTFILFLLMIIILAILGFCVKDIYDNLSSTSQKKIEVLDKIKDYDYQLNENDSPYFKKIFKKLKKELMNKDVNEEKYAKLMSELFVIDFYSLEYAINKNDIGGVQFVYGDYQTDFQKYAKDTVYRYVENNIYKNRKQTLPNIKNISVKNIEQKEFESNTKSDDEAYYVTIKIGYETDLEYPEECNLILIHNNNKLEIASMNE